MDDNFKNDMLALLTAIERQLSRIAESDNDEGDAIDHHVSAIREDLKRILSRP